MEHYVGPDLMEDLAKDLDQPQADRMDERYRQDSTDFAPRDARRDVSPSSDFFTSSEHSRLQ